MDQQQANQLANVVGGAAWHSGGGIWLVMAHTADGGVVVYSDELIARYENDEAFGNGDEPIAKYALT